MTAKGIYERLVLVPGPRRFVPFVTMSYAPTPPPLTLHLFLDFPVFSFNLFHGPGVALQKGCQHCSLASSCGNLADSRYPRCPCVCVFVR